MSSFFWVARSPKLEIHLCNLFKCGRKGLYWDFSNITGFLKIQEESEGVSSCAEWVSWMTIAKEWDMLDRSQRGVGGGGVVFCDIEAKVGWVSSDIAARMRWVSRISAAKVRRKRRAGCPRILLTGNVLQKISIRPIVFVLLRFCDLNAVLFPKVSI